MLPLLPLLVGLSLSLAECAYANVAAHRLPPLTQSPLLELDPQSSLEKPNLDLESHAILDTSSEEWEDSPLLNPQPQPRHQLRTEWIQEPPQPVPDVPFQYQTRSVNDLARYSGFRFCAHLDGSYFDASIPLRPECVQELLEAKIDRVLPLYEQVGVRMRRVSFQRAKKFDPFTADKNANKEHKHLAPVQEPPSQSKLNVQVTRPRFLKPAVFVALVDVIAEQLYRDMLRHPRDAPSQEEFTERTENDKFVHRFACYMAADGNNAWNRLVLGPYKLLRYVEGKTYFAPVQVHYPREIKLTDLGTEVELLRADMLRYMGTNVPTAPPLPLTDRKGDRRFRQKKALLPDGESQTAPLSLYYGPQVVARWMRMQRNKVATMDSDQSPIGQQRHRLAYLLTVHRDQQNVKGLVRALLDDYVTILIHVDAKYPELKQQLLEFVASLVAKDPTLADRLKVMGLSISGSWGHASLIHMQLQGYMELTEMNRDWQYVVNLSGEDYPLRHNDAIYAHLRQNFRHQSIIEYWDHMHAYDRHHRPAHFPNEMHPRSDWEQSKSNIRPPFPHWQLFKHHQWMILHRDFVRFLQSSPSAMAFLAYSEFVQIPDESFFAVVGLNVYEPVRAHQALTRSSGVAAQTSSSAASLRHCTSNNLPLPPTEPRPGFWRRSWRKFRRFLRKLAFWKRKETREVGIRAPLPEPPVPCSAPVSMSLRKRIYAHIREQPLISPAQKHMLEFPPKAYSPRQVTMQDLRRLVQVTAEHGMMYVRKLDNRDQTAPEAQAIQQLRDVDWLRTFWHTLDVEEEPVRELEQGFADVDQFSDAEDSSLVESHALESVSDEEESDEEEESYASSVSTSTKVRKSTKICTPKWMESSKEE